MFHDKSLYNKINKMHLRALRSAYRDYESNFETLLKRDNSVAVHQRNLQLLMVEIYKTKVNLNPVVKLICCCCCSSVVFPSMNLTLS